MGKRSQLPKWKIGKNFQNFGSIEPHNPEMIDIGDNVVLGGSSKIITHGPIRPYRKNNKIILEDLVWTGYNCIILPGVKIGKLAMIGAGSVVTKDVPRYSIAAGNPIQIIKVRTGLEILRFYTIRVLMNKILGTVEPNFSLLKINDIKYIFDLPRYDFIENDPLLLLHRRLCNLQKNDRPDYNKLTMEDIWKVYT